MPWQRIDFSRGTGELVRISTRTYLKGTRAEIQQTNMFISGRLAKRLGWKEAEVPDKYGKSGKALWLFVSVGSGENEGKLLLEHAEVQAEGAIKAKVSGAGSVSIQSTKIPFSRGAVLRSAEAKFAVQHDKNALIVDMPRPRVREGE